MPAIYRCQSPLTAVETQALVFYCSTPRYQPHFEEFLVNGLKLENYSLIAVPGGVQVLTMADYLPKFGWAIWRWTKFLVDADRPPRIVLIGHDGCRWYKHLMGAFVSQSTESIIADLVRTRQNLQERFPAVRAELYYAKPDAAGHIVFEQL